ncbi:hypothetical protein Bca52824_014893 [Brassica carinata]|uniref:Uncharacterized protein n=1 Tax=Brassica carinata TaxID=52824 RepID=A0A8X7W3C0_BRACI|nr:hypothetical protein Bca52824_014893 [Brassica carinata]
MRQTRDKKVEKMRLELKGMNESEEKMKEKAMEMREWRRRVERIEKGESEKKKVKERLEQVLKRMDLMEKKGVAVFTICVGFEAISVVAVFLGKETSRAEMPGGALVLLMLLISSIFLCSFCVFDEKELFSFGL